MERSENAADDMWDGVKDTADDVWDEMKDTASHIRDEANPKRKAENRIENAADKTENLMSRAVIKSRIRRRIYWRKWMMRSAVQTIIPAEISRTLPYKARRFWEPQWVSIISADQHRPSEASVTRPMQVIVTPDRISRSSASFCSG